MKGIKKVTKNAYDETFQRILQVVEKNVVPDPFVRAGIRYLLAGRAKEASDSVKTSLCLSPSPTLTPSPHRHFTIEHAGVRRGVLRPPAGVRRGAQVPAHRRPNRRRQAPDHAPL